MSATSDTILETRMAKFVFRENKSSIVEIMRLLTPGRYANPPGDVTLVLETPV